MKVKALESKIEPPVHLIPYINGFSILSSRRTSGMGGFDPIAMSEIVAYLTIYPWHDIDTFVKYVIVLDNYFIKHKGEEHERKHRNQNRPNKGRTGHR